MIAGHPWRQIVTAPTCWRANGHGYHESLLRSFRILQEVKTMLQRGDSNLTITHFIEHSEGAPEVEPYDCGLLRGGRE